MMATLPTKLITTYKVIKSGLNELVCLCYSCKVCKVHEPTHKFSSFELELMYHTVKIGKMVKQKVLDLANV